MLNKKTTDKDVKEIDKKAASKGGIYTLLSHCFPPPEQNFYESLKSGELEKEIKNLLETSGLEIDFSFSLDDDYDILNARYNDLFIVSFSRYKNRTIGELETEGPTVPLYESSYREGSSWKEINLDLARAYDYFGLEMDDSYREHHDHIRLQLEFAGYLCRLESFGEKSARKARLDFLDRHLRVLTDNIYKNLKKEPGTGIYENFANLLDSFTKKDREDLDSK